SFGARRIEIRSRRKPRILEPVDVLAVRGVRAMRVFVAASLSCFVALAAFVAIVMWREPALHRGDLHPVIYPGHEPGVMRFIEPLAHHGFAGLKVRGVQIHGASIRVQMRSTGEAVAPCVLPAWAQAPGALQITLLPQS